MNKEKKMEAIDINKIVGVLESGEILMISKLHWNGVSCSYFDYLTQYAVEERCDLETVKDYCGYLWKEAVADETTELGYDDYMQEILELSLQGDGYFPGHDTSDTYYITDEDKELLEDHYEATIECFDCVGGGTGIFKNFKFEKVFRQDLIDQAIKHEAEIDRAKRKPPKLTIV
jgi:hypothetical protein